MFVLQRDSEPVDDASKDFKQLRYAVMCAGFFVHKAATSVSIA